MTKKTVREQTKILTLTDKNNSEIDSLEANATRKAAQHARMTKELKDTILERESELEQTRRQVADLSLVQKKRDEQQKEIEQLEATIEEMNKEHFDSTCGPPRASEPAYWFRQGPGWGPAPCACALAHPPVPVPVPVPGSLAPWPVL